MDPKLAELARKALADLPAGTSHGEAPAPQNVYLPRSHLKAMHPDNLLVKGMRGAGKTFWWSALQNDWVRRLVRHTDRSLLSENDEVRTGFGVKPALDDYPSKDVLQYLISSGIVPRMVWRTVQAWQLAPVDHPLRKQPGWPERATYVGENPETIERLFQERDEEFDQRGAYFMILFDALDRCADNWKEMYPIIRGLLQTALDMRSYRRLRVKVFLRSDQVDESKIADFPDAAKVVSSAVELNWPRRELYGLLWHYLANGQNGGFFRRFLGGGNWASVDVEAQSVHSVPRTIVKEEDQRDRFHLVAGEWMGRGPKRGFPYTWIPNHLGDTEGRVSPRSFLAALQEAARDTADAHPEHAYALHYDSIKRGVQEASKIRVAELREDYPWVDRVLTPLAGMAVPCTFDEIVERWRERGVLDHLSSEVGLSELKLPPLHLERGSDGVRLDLEFLGVFLRLHDGRTNIPDVFRVGYGLGRRGGVRPIR